MHWKHKTMNWPHQQRTPVSLTHQKRPQFVHEVSGHEESAASLWSMICQRRRRHVRLAGDKVNTRHLMEYKHMENLQCQFFCHQCENTWQWLSLLPSPQPTPSSPRWTPGLGLYLTCCLVGYEHAEDRNATFCCQFENTMYMVHPHLHSSC